LPAERGVWLDRTMHEHHDIPADASLDPATYWEARYADQDRMWSGRVNAVLADTVERHVSPRRRGDPRDLRALDLGCGEGGDVLWLAAQGWAATGVDLSGTATDRGRAAAEAAGLGDRTTFVAADLAVWDTDERFDLVTASFLQSWPVEIPRDAILHRATRFVAPGGHLLVTAHAAPPGGVPEEFHGHRFPTPTDDLDALALAPDEWDVVAADTRPRSVQRDDGTVHDLLDSVVLVRRR